MRIEMLVIADCPNTPAASDNLREALTRTGRGGVEVGVRLVTTPEDAAALPFAGSPTILIDGSDPFPSSGPTSELACRIYPTGHGLAGAPTVEQLVEILSSTP